MHLLDFTVMFSLLEYNIPTTYGGISNIVTMGIEMTCITIHDSYLNSNIDTLGESCYHDYSSSGTRKYMTNHSFLYNWRFYDFTSGIIQTFYSSPSNKYIISLIVGYHLRNLFPVTIANNSISWNFLIVLHVKENAP